MKKIMILAAGLAFTASAYAQSSITFAPEIGLNLANMHGKYKTTTGTESTTSTIKLGVKAGANVNIPIGDRLCIQPGLFYSTKGYKSEKEVNGSTTKHNVTLHCFDVPVNVQYMFNDPSEGRFFIGAGPYVGVAFSGHDKIITTTAGGTSTDVNYDIKFGNDKKTNDLRRFDFGAQVNAGYLLRSGIFFRAMYQAGIANLVPEGTSESTTRNTNITISAGYMLGNHPKGKGPRMKGATPM